MFCIRCGKELPDFSNFCLYCGERLNPPAQRPAVAPATARLADTTPTLVLKPHFVPSTILLPTLFLWGFLTIWFGGFCGGFSMIGVKAIEPLLGVTFPPGSTFIFWGAAAFFGVPVIAVTMFRRKCRFTEYRIYSDRIESVYEGRSRKVQSVPFTQVTGLEFKRVRAMPELKLGTITISTPYTVKLNNQVKNSVVLENIENAGELYERLRALTTDVPPGINTGD